MLYKCRSWTSPALLSLWLLREQSGNGQGLGEARAGGALEPTAPSFWGSSLHVCVVHLNPLGKDSAQRKVEDLGACPEGSVFAPEVSEMQTGPAHRLNDIIFV